MESSSRSGGKNRLWARVTIVGLIVAVLALGFWLLLPKPRLLLKLAHPIVQVHYTEDPGGDNWSWLSDEKLILLTDNSVADTSVAWRGKAELMNVTTGVGTPLSGLTGVLNRDGVSPAGTPFNFELSPDQSWLIWINFTEDAPLHYGAAHLDGTHYRTWNVNPQNDYFFSDGSHLVHRDVDHKNMLTLRDLADRRQDRQLAVTAPAAKELLARHEAQVPRYVDVSQSEDVKAGWFKIKTYRTGDTLQAMNYDCCDTSHPPSPLEDHLVKLPEGAELVESDAGTNKEQSEIYYHLEISETSPFLKWMRQRLPQMVGKPTVKEALWVSRSDGKDFHEIGELPAHRIGDANKDHLEAIEWLPGGKQISFYWRGTLYVVPAERGH